MNEEQRDRDEERKNSRDYFICLTFFHLIASVMIIRLNNYIHTMIK